MRRTKQLATDSRPRGVFITATDTGVGKTLVASALVTRLIQRGIDVGVMKPIETGVSRSAKAQSDGARLRMAAGSHDPMAEVSPYVLRLPVAPLSAARAGGNDSVRRAAPITAASSVSAASEARACGGGRAWAAWVCPSRRHWTCWDLIHQIEVCLADCGRTIGLGGINHASLTLRRAPPAKDSHRGVWSESSVDQCSTKTARVQEQSTVSSPSTASRGFPCWAPSPTARVLNRNWNEGLVRLAGTAPITKLARLVLARITHEGSSRKRADAKRDRHSEA